MLGSTQACSLLFSAISHNARIMWCLISGLQNISSTMRLCKPMQNASDLDWMLRWSRNAFVMMGMMDYPYATSFMSSLPANPVNVSCDRAADYPNDPIAGLREAIGVLYNISSGLIQLFHTILHKVLPYLIFGAYAKSIMSCIVRGVFWNSCKSRHCWKYTIWIVFA